MRVPSALILFLSVLVSNGGTASAVDLSRVSIHGFLSQGYLKSTANDYLGVSTEEGTFAFSEAGINFSAQLTEELRLGLQLFARDFGKEGNFDVVLDWAVGDYRWKDWMGIRFGKVKMPAGFYNQGRDMDMLRTPILLPQAIYSERTRDMTNAYLGGELYGFVPIPFAGDIEYQLFGGTMDLDDVSIIRNFLVKGALENMPPGSQITLGDLSVEVKYTIGGALRWNTPVENLRLGLTLLTSDVDMEGDLISSFPFAPQVPILQATSQLPVYVDMKVNYSYVFSAEFSMWDLTLAGEFFHQKSDIKTNLSLGIPGVPSTVEFDKKYAGFYGTIAYRWLDWLEIATYYCVYYPDTDDKDGDFYAARGQPKYLAWLRDLSLTLRFDITSYWLIKLEAHFMDGAAMVDTGDDPNDLEKYWGLFAAKTTFNF